MDTELPTRPEQFPSGSGKGGVICYIRRSAEDRTGKPLHAQFETNVSYYRDILSKKQTETERENEIRAFFIDNGISGATHPSKRPGMSKLLEEMSSIVDEKRGDEYVPIHIIVYDATRLARSIDVGSQLKSSFERAGATLHLSQPRMIVEGANAELFFGLNLQMAASERTATITRVKTSFKHNPNWDPRRSFGWKFDGSGTKPVEIPEEQELLSQIKDMYEVKGMKVSEISDELQKKTGGRRCRRVGASDKEIVPWTSSEISFLVRKHNWSWSGGKTTKDLETEVDEAIKKGKGLEDFLSERRDQYYNGVKINRAMLKRYFPSSEEEWKAKARYLLRNWIKQDKFSVDDIANMLNENVPRPDGKGWPRQTAWRLMKEEEKRIERHTINQSK